MLGICLKRYGYDTVRKQPYRNGRRRVTYVIFLMNRVIIPKYIELSNFVTQEENLKGGPPKKYRLVFYSTVCHRGQYVHSGHYVSIVWDGQNDRYFTSRIKFAYDVDGCILMMLLQIKLPLLNPSTFYLMRHRNFRHVHV